MLKKIFLYFKTTFIKWYKSYKKLTIPQKIVYYIVIYSLLIIYVLLINWWKYFVCLPLILIIIISLWVSNKNKYWASLVNSNIFIFGTKGSGKDLIMQAGVYLNRKKVNYVSNMNYGYSCKQVDNLSNIMSLGSNTFDNLVKGNISIIPKNDYMEGKVFLLSDASIYFPSHEDYLLKKEYPSFPLFYAISRHLYNMPFVVNTQVNGRLWKSLREQVQDGYIEALKTRGKDEFLWNSIPILRNYLVVKIRYYKKEESAIMGLLPFKKVAILNKIADKTVYMTVAGATEEQYNAQNGVIKESYVIIKKSKIVYDSRGFHKLFFGYEVEGK